jgi:hypothetical protein
VAVVWCHDAGGRDVAAGEPFVAGNGVLDREGRDCPRPASDIGEVTR